MSRSLQAALAPRIAPIVHANITTHYPYHDSHLYRASGAAFDAIIAHPAFGNAYDWHSSVHSHWTAVHLLEHFACTGEAREPVERLRAAVAHNLTAAHVAAEAAHLAEHLWYERPYGRAWLLALTAAIAASPLADVRALLPALRAAADTVAEEFVRWLDVMPAPVRHGVHANTAFALGLALDAARALELGELEGAVVERTREWFAGDRDYPHAWERSGHDFLSPGLAEADLLRRVVEPAAFRSWWEAFLDSAGQNAEIFTVANVPRVADGQIVHLHGLNLSRAAMLARIASALLAAPGGGSSNGAGASELLGYAERLYRAGADFAVDGDYHSTHWLATFAWNAAVSIDIARVRSIGASTQIVAVEDVDFAWMLDGKPAVRRELRLPPGGVDEPVILGHVRAIAASLRERGCAGSWMVVSGREIVGLCGYKNAPSTKGEVEIGYGITPSRRRRGHASRAVAAVIAYARLDPPVRTIVAKTDVGNVASQTVLQRNGFERAGEGPDPEDGAPIVFWRLTL